MKVLFLAHRVPFPPNKGEKIRTFHQLKYLHDQGYEISLAAPYEDDEELNYFTELDKNYCEKVVAKKLPAKFLRLPSALLTGKALSVANFYTSALQSAIDNMITTSKFDVILCTASSMAEYIFNSKSIQQLSISPQLFMDFMDLDSDKWRQYADRAKFPMKWVYQREAKLIAKFEQRIAERFDACFFITESEKALFSNAVSDSDNIFAVENGIDTQMFKPAVNKKTIQQPVLLFTGVMDYAPNVDAVLWFVENVWQKVLKKWPQAKFYIAGMSPSDKIKALASVQGVVVTGFVEDIMPFFDQATVFVGPFRIARGVQNKVLQAFACGVPVIATSMGAEGIRCADNESILLAHTPDEFMQQLNRLTEDSSFTQKITENALANIHKFYAWDSVLAPLNQMLLQKTKIKTDKLQ